MAMKQLVGLLFVVLLCQAEIIEAEDDVVFNSADLDLSANAQGQFAADHGDESQDLGLSDQSFRSGPWPGSWGSYGDEHSFDHFYGSFGIVQYYTQSIRHSPAYWDVDDSYVVCSGCRDQRRLYNWDRSSYSWGWGGNWHGDWNGCGHHNKYISYAWNEVTRVQYYNNFWRGYNYNSQVVLVAQRVTRPFYQTSRWHAPHDYRRSYSTYPAYNSYSNFDWNSWSGY